MERTFWRDTFSGSNARLLILLGCLVCFFSAFCRRGTSGTCLGVGVCIHMRTWCLDFYNCDAFEPFD